VRATDETVAKVENVGSRSAHFHRLLGRFLLTLVCCGTWGCRSPKPSAAPAPKQNPDETDQIIDSLLGEMHQLESSNRSETKAALSIATDTFDADRERIRGSVAKWEHGTGATLRFLKEATGEKLSLIFVDESAPAYKKDAGMYMIQATARVTGGKIIGHFVLLLKDLRAGTYRGDDHTKDAVMAVLMAETAWDGQNPETAWSINRESWCEVYLRSAADTGIEGEFRARLVDNRGTGFINVDSGYLFTKK
jgi:hypothetical protein